MNEYFITVKGTNTPIYSNQITIEDILNATNDEVFDFNDERDETATRTYKRCKDAATKTLNTFFDDRIVEAGVWQSVVESYVNKTSEALNWYIAKWNKYINEKDMQKHYHTFMIPKHSGGVRRIDAPEDELKEAQRELKTIIEDACIPYHTCAYAYVANRTAKDSAIKHQKFGGNWYFKSDLTNFFGSTNREFVYEQMKKIFPFSHMDSEKFGKLEKALNVAFLNDVLPQGSVISPTLTNIIMIPIDYDINKWASEHKCAYTRYADDMEISSHENIGKLKITLAINKILKDNKAPYEINQEKTRFGSRAGHNYMLGMCINKDNNITVGHETKKVFKAMLFNFMRDFRDKNYWTKQDTLVLQGKMNYYSSIEPEYIKHVIFMYTKKFCMSPKVMMKFILKAR